MTAPARIDVEAPVAAEKIVIAPGGPKAAILRSPHSAFSFTTIASISLPNRSSEEEYQKFTYFWMSANNASCAD